MHNVLVCDDNPQFVKAMLKILEKYAGLYDATVIGFTDGAELLRYCKEHTFDIVYMDIELGKENGMSLAMLLKAINPQVLVIYISAYGTYYVEMVQAEPFRFILKDYSDIARLEKQISNTLAEAMHRIDPKDIWTYTFGKKEYSISLSKIAYFHSMARTIHISGDIGDRPRYFYGKIDDIENKIRELNNDFFRINKSCIVNKKLSMRYTNYEVKVENKTFSVTQSYRKRYQEERNWPVYIPKNL